MKIVRIIARLNVGGPARQVVWLTQALNGKDAQSILLTGTVLAGEENMEYFAAENGVVPVYIPEMSRELSLKDVVSLWKVYRHIVRENPNIIHTHTAKAGFIGRAAGFMYRWLNWKKIHIVHTFHGHVFHSYYGNLKTKIFLLIEKALARMATDKIVVITKQQFEEIHEKFAVGNRAQFQVVPLGIDLAPFQVADDRRANFRRENRVADDEILIAFVGRLTEIKNISMLLQTAAIYRKQKTSDSPKLKFLIAGDGNLRGELEDEAEELGLTETVKFVGNQTDVSNVYAAADIVALCSLNEGTPLSLIEAMASAKPFISTNVGGVRDLAGKIQLAENGFDVCERGVKIDVATAENFYKGLIYLAKSETLQKSLALSGKKFVESQYSKERLINDLENLYRDLAKT